MKGLTVWFKAKPCLLFRYCYAWDMAVSNFKNPNIANFLKRNHIAVLATANKETGQPYATTIYYATDHR